MVNKVPQIKASRPNRVRNAFDLSQRHLFTAHAGMLLPVLSLDLLPHDHVEINASDFMRTMPMNTAAFLSMRSVYEFFYVPYHQLWPQFDQFITGMQDYHSAAINDLMGSSSPTQIPCVNLAAVYQDLYEARDAEFRDEMGYDSVLGSYRLLDLLGFSRDVKCDGTHYFSDDTSLNLDYLSYNVNLFRPAAYQKIYQDFYRNTQYEPFDVKSFSLDKYQGGVSSELMSEFLLKLRYRNAQKDYLSNIRPSQLFTMPTGLGSSPVLNLQTSHVSNPALDIIGADSLGAYVSTHGLHDGNTSSSLTDFQSINVSSLRSAFAVDKLLRVTMQAGKTFQDQMRAHYGIEIPDSRDGKVKYLGGFDSNIQLSDIEQTGGTTTAPDAADAGYLGKLTSKGTSSGNGRIVYDAKEHGILMCIYSLVPMASYDSTRLDPMNIKLNRFDYFTPEFENLGMQPLPIKTISTFTGDDHSNDIIGWQPRYSEYKTALDINHGQFGYKDALSYYTTSRFRQDAQFPIGGLDQLKVNPSWLDSIFIVNYNGTELTDCIYGGCNFNIIKVSDMSEDGMPRI